MLESVHEAVVVVPDAVPEDVRDRVLEPLEFAGERLLAGSVGGGEARGFGALRDALLGGLERWSFVALDALVGGRLRVLRVLLASSHPSVSSLSSDPSSSDLPRSPPSTVSFSSTGSVGSHAESLFLGGLKESPAKANPADMSAMTRPMTATNRKRSAFCMPLYRASAGQTLSRRPPRRTVRARMRRRRRARAHEIVMWPSSPMGKVGL